MNESPVEVQVESAIEWIEALASNDFPHATKTMKNAKGLCCLGAARELFGYAAGPYTTPHPGLPSNGETSQYGLNVYIKATLIRYNDLKAAAHSDIVHMLVGDPYRFFIPEVAEEVAYHFWTGGDK